MDLEHFIFEDVGDGDITSEALLGDELAEGRIFPKMGCVVAGLHEAREIFEKFDAEVTMHVKDGDLIEANRTVMKMKGSAKGILKGERLALNMISRMSGIATLTNHLLEKCRQVNPRVDIAATRKTTPGFRQFEKKAVLLGGGKTHRYGLYDAILIKDNHIKIVGSIKDAVEAAAKRFPEHEIEVEVEDLKALEEALDSPADIVMLDNMSLEAIEVARNSINQSGKEIRVEISGGITPENIVDYAPYADVISVGWLTHSVKSIDFSLEIETKL